MKLRSHTHHKPVIYYNNERKETEESKMEALKILVVDDESRMRKLGKRLSCKKEFPGSGSR